MLPGGCQPFLAIGRGENLVAFGSQPSLQDLDVRRVVVDDEDARRGSHNDCPSNPGNIRPRPEMHKDGQR
jgi:hypothetical protein